MLGDFQKRLVIYLLKGASVFENDFHSQNIVSPGGDFKTLYKTFDIQFSLELVGVCVMVKRVFGVKLLQKKQALLSQRKRCFDAFRTRLNALRLVGPFRPVKPLTQ